MVALYGIPVEQADESGESALIAAVEKSDVESVRILLAAGADPTRMRFNRPVLRYATHPEIIQVLLDMGVDRADLSPEGSRTLCGYPAEPDCFLSDACEADYRRAPTRRFGSANPERMAEPFWLGMIHAGVSAAEAADLFEYRPKGQPVWSAYRFGQSTTVVRPDLIVQIGGEHEDFYDEDFCIYNDVFVHRGAGTVEVFGYPEDIFAPTDFHTATVVDDSIYIVGGLGYPEARRPGHTPVYQLSLNDFSITRIEPSGEGPGWIYKHRADLREGKICISGGRIVGGVQDDYSELINQDCYVLDVAKLEWRRL